MEVARKRRGKHKGGSSGSRGDVAEVVLVGRVIHSRVRAVVRRWFHGDLHIVVDAGRSVGPEGLGYHAERGVGGQGRPVGRNDPVRVRPV